MEKQHKLGPFRLGTQIDRGGFSVVYRARHVETGERVAIKVLLSERARQPRRRREFRREVQALAKLNHPAIAAVLDYGEIDAKLAAAGPEAFVERAPWFALEYVEADPLETSPGAWNWRRLQSVLQSILDGLAHAHARSIVHRDLKPGNLLVDLRSGETEVTIVDFGIARLFDAETENLETDSETVTGTPKYMAPEQIRGAWRDQGPWTDLYALGCMTWRLVCGDAPFSNGTNTDILRRHLRTPLPPFSPTLAVPPGLEGWLRGLLHKSVQDRTRHAADAAWQLRALGEPDAATPSQAGGSGEAGSEREPAESGAPASSTMAETETTVLPTGDSVSASTIDESGDLPGADDTVEKPPEALFDAGEASTGRTEADGSSPNSGPPPIPDSWRRRHTPRAARVPKAGLELFALREIPMVDRDDRREQLWERLRRVRRDQTTDLVTLEGRAGCGKTRLAQWLSRRAREVGAARVLEARHTPSSAPGAGLRQMAEEALRTEGLGRREVHERLLGRLPSLGPEARMREVDARALTELLRPTDDDAETVEGPRYRFSRPEQKYALIGRFFDRIASDRPLVVLLDDLHWGRETVRMLESLHESTTSRPPILFVATVRSDLVSERPEFEDRLVDLCDTADAARLAIEPLEADDHRELIDRLLALEPRFADRLTARTDGNPLFAIQLLRDWIDRSLLRPGPRGFMLDEQVEAAVPTDIHELWLERLGRLVRDLPDVADPRMWRALERAAALGREVDAEEWRAVCRGVGLEAIERVRDRLVKRGLAESTAAGWAFTHGLLVDSLARRARRDDRWADHHRRCAELLERLEPERPRRTAARRADHWIKADDLERALRPLYLEATRLRGAGKIQACDDVLDRREHLLEELEIPGDDPRYIENDLGRARGRLEMGRSSPREVLEAVESARERADRIGDDRLAARALALGSRGKHHAGESEAADQKARRAADRARASRDQGVLALSLIRRGQAAFRLGDIDAARRQFSEAREYAERAGDRRRQLIARRGMAKVANSSGSEQEALQIFRGVLKRARRAGFRAVEMNCVNGLGEVARFRGDADTARKRYRQHARIARELHLAAEVGITELNLAQVELMAGRPDVAAEKLDEGLDHFETLGRRAQFEHLFALVEAAHASRTRDWERFDRLIAEYEEGWPRDAQVLKDHPWLAEMAGEFADDAGELERARRAWRLARELAHEIGDDEAVERLHSRLGE